MKRLVLILTLAAFATLVVVSSAQARFGMEKFDVTYTNADGSPATQAGSHPYQMTTTVYFNKLSPNRPDEEFKDGTFAQIAGLVGDPDAVPRCSTADFLTFSVHRVTQCPDSTAVGTARTQVEVIAPSSAVYNLVPPPGVAEKLGFIVAQTPVTIEVGLKDRPPYNVNAVLINTPQSVGALASVLTLWGDPADPSHDPYRGNCVSSVNQDATPVIPLGEFPALPSYGNCTTNAPSVPLLTLPRACEGPLTTSYAIDSWQHPGTLLPDGEPDLSDPNWVSGSLPTHDDAEPPSPLGMTGCAKLGFAPSITAQPDHQGSHSPTGLDFSLDVHDEGLTSPSGLAQSDIEKAIVTLARRLHHQPLPGRRPEHLHRSRPGKRDRQLRTRQQAARTNPRSARVEVETPLLDETVNGVALHRHALRKHRGHPPGPLPGDQEPDPRDHRQAGR